MSERRASRRRRVRGLVGAVLLALAGCASEVTVKGGGCIGAAGERFEGVDWANVETLDIRIRQDNFTPMVFSLLRDRPYVLRISNGDAGSHALRAPEFFQTVAIDRIRTGDEPAPKGCFTAVSLPPGETVEIRLVALVDGRYGFRDSGLVDLGYETGSGFGAIYVE